MKTAPTILVVEDNATNRKLVADVTFHADRAALQIDNFPRQRQAQPRAFVASRRARLELLELGEEALEIVPFDTDPGVMDRYREFT